MEILSIWEYDDVNRVLINKEGNYYLLKEEYISGTFYKNWWIFEDYGNNLQYLEDNNTKECNLHSIGSSYTSLYECLEYLMYMED